MEKSHATVTTERDHSGQHHVHETGKAADHSNIQGWGADLDHKNRPAYPMERTPPRLDGVHWTQPEDQPIDMKIYHSVERPGVTPVFGTSAPPSGLSGRVRDVAYKLSENDIRHWLLLMFADRVNMVEGIGSDLLQGRLPNIFAEMGGPAEWKHNRTGLITKMAIGSAAIGLTYLMLRNRRDRSERD